MSKFASSLYFGSLMHRRYQPRRHELRYDVANLLVDVDELPRLSQTLWLFGYNRLSLFSVQDKNHGPADGTPIVEHLRSLMNSLELTAPVQRIFMFCYPAVIGKIFNPLTVYFGFDARDRLAAVVYEVNNTFGQRHCYALAVDGENHHSAQKQFYVSPFNPAQGEYRFSVDANGEHLRLNIALFEGSALKLCARFDGQRQELSDARLLRSLFSFLMQPLKIVAGIHWEALKLYLKGLRPMPRPAHPRFAATISRGKT